MKIVQAVLAGRSNTFFLVTRQAQVRSESRLIKIDVCIIIRTRAILLVKAL